MGDVHKISKDFNDPTYQKLLFDMDKGRVGRQLSDFMSRPAYAYTCAEVGGIRWYTEHTTN